MSQRVDVVDEGRPQRALSYGDDIKLLAAVDFGTYGSAFAWCYPGAPSPPHIIVLDGGGDAAVDENTEKVLSALLIENSKDINDETYDTVSAIGENARTKYFDARDKNEISNYLYFEHFKKELYNEADSIHKDKNVVACDDNGERKLSYLITTMLKHIKNKGIDEINDTRDNEGLTTLNMNQIFFAITVPAIWDEMSKEFMACCATQAGIEKFELVSEPVAATFCVLNAKKNSNEKGLKNLKINTDGNGKSKTKMIVLDCGGGTIDAGCIDIEHYDEKESVFQVSEIHYGDGIFTGGLHIDNKFIELLPKLFEQTVFDPCTNIRKEEELKQLTESKENDNKENDDDNNDNNNKKSMKNKNRNKLLTAHKLLSQTSVLVTQRRYFTQARKLVSFENDENKNNDNNDRIVKESNVQLEDNIHKVNSQLKKKKKTKYMKFNEMRNTISQFKVEYIEYDEDAKNDAKYKKHIAEKKKSQSEMEIMNLAQLQRSSSTESDNDWKENDNILYQNSNDSDMDSSFSHRNLRKFYDPSLCWNDKTNYEKGVCNEAAFKLTYSGQYLSISNHGWKYLHSNVCNEISKFLYKLLKDIDSPISNVVLVGGFSGSVILRKWLEYDFPKIEFHYPESRPQLACVEGALCWLCQKTQLKKIRAKYSFGLQLDVKYNEAIHGERLEHKIDDPISPSGIMPNCIEWLTTADNEYDKEFHEYFEHFGIRKNTNKLEIDLYATQNKYARYSDEKGVKIVKKWKLNIQDILKNYDNFNQMNEMNEINDKSEKNDKKDEGSELLPVKLELEFRDNLMFLYICDLKERRITPQGIKIDQNEIRQIVNNRTVRLFDSVNNNDARKSNNDAMNDLNITNNTSNKPSFQQ